MSDIRTLPKNDELPKSALQRLKSLPAINIYRMIAKVPQCLGPWTDMLKSLYESKVDIRYREMAILRQASIAKSDYELHQHKFIARANGITDAEIDIICHSVVVSSLSEKENLVCDMAEQLERYASLSDRTRQSLENYFDSTELTELIIVVSFYCCVARVLNATHTPIEESNPLEGQSSPMIKPVIKERSSRETQSVPTVVPAVEESYFCETKNTQS